jgi:hypothetical protein
MKIFGCTWFSQMNERKIIGIVVWYNDGEQRVEARIGCVRPSDEQQDQEHVCQTGARFPLHLACKLLNLNEKELK